MLFQSPFQLISALVVVLFISVVPAQSQERRVIINQGADYFGGDYKTIKDVPLATCEKSCLGDENCKAFTYNEQAKWCFLKNEVGELQSFKGAIAGRVVGEEKPVVPELAEAPKLEFRSEERRVGKEC